MKKILLLHGANLNQLGKRDPDHYGSITLLNLENLVKLEAKKYEFDVIAYQSNHEGSLIDILQKEYLSCEGIIANLGAFTHYSYALHDALLDTKLPIVEVHLSDIKQRESWRHLSVIESISIASIMGKQAEGYREAVKLLVEHIDAN